MFKNHKKIKIKLYIVPTGQTSHIRDKYRKLLRISPPEYKPT